MAGKKRKSSGKHEATLRTSGPLQAKPPADVMAGVVTRAHGLWYEVSVSRPDAVFIATIRGTLKQQSKRTDIVAVGDHVWITDAGEGEAVIESVEPRTSVFSRTARNTRDTEQVILANPDQVLIMFAARNPEPHVRMLDRFIILAERQELPVRIVVSKMDLEPDHSGDDPLGPAVDRFNVYTSLYPVHFISAITGDGIEGLRSELEGRISVIAGPSGVGKSSLLNALDPEHHRDTGVVSEATGKGRHTTIGARMYEIADGTFIADTPGMRSLAMHAIPGEELDWCFREFRPYLDDCRFRGCTHVHEPGCAVRAAVDRDEISDDRYQSYVLVRSGSA